MISVLTVNYHSSKQVTLLAQSLREHGGNDAVELIVLNNSPQEAIQFERDDSLPHLVLQSENVGFAAGINRAFRASRGEVVFIANPDVRVGPETFDRAVAYLNEHPEVGLVLPLLRYPGGEIQFSVRQFYTWPVVLYARSPLRMFGIRPAFFRRYHCEELGRTQPTPVDWGLGAAMFLRRGDIMDETILDERFFMYFEDVDLCYRTWQRGRKVMYCPHIECVHAHQRTSRNPFSLAGWWHTRSLLRFILKHHGLPRRPVGFVTAP